LPFVIFSKSFIFLWEIVVRFYCKNVMGEVIKKCLVISFFE